MSWDPDDEEPFVEELVAPVPLAWFSVVTPFEVLPTPLKVLLAPFAEELLVGVTSSRARFGGVCTWFTGCTDTTFRMGVTVTGNGMGVTVGGATEGDTVEVSG